MIKKMTISKSFPKLLYLDHNKWVELERVYSQKKKNSKISNLLELIRGLIKDNKLRL